MTAFLVVNADDFGLTQGNNRAIVDAHHSGIVTSTSLLANGQAFQHAIELAHQNPHLGVGVHLTLTEGPSTARDSGSVLTSNGLFPLSNRPFIQALLWGHLPQAAIRREFEAQIRRVMSEGISPTHLDGHKYIHLLPGIASVVTSLARQFAIPYVRIPRRSADTLSRPARIPGLAAVVLMGRLAYSKADGLQCANRFTGFVDTGHLTLDILKRLLRKPVSGLTELVCHPAYLTEEHDQLLRQGYQWIMTYDFATETAAVSDPEMRAFLQASGWKLSHFGAL